MFYQFKIERVKKLLEVEPGTPGIRVVFRKIPTLTQYDQEISASMQNCVGLAKLLAKKILFQKICMETVWMYCDY